MNVEQARAWITAIATTVEAEAETLTRLDSAIGDGDHGANLKRGFAAVRAALEGFEAHTVGDVLTKTGATLISKVGGASGPLYGSAFRAMGKALASPDVTTEQLGDALDAGLAAIRKLGGAQPGDKTMVDAWLPAVAAYRKKGPRAAAAAAEEGAKATTELRARKGRASYLGERSIGHQDPGATSTALIFRALA
ncbi:dihydroxyacetone kinase subunit DhaL [Catenuloplanes atrovinosus]|uniref:Dihydroxyacetone kinase-like protein n=1 Tax=Catenuloplanes atrovinosus TaxID=137266 RepID=A0AAE4C8C9_9ACTN|nr:dihydroxyacetone kinase subunit DhaL [Catenuloplanes atrovinosus]MDR7274858.1 dihydroxyacetone kinase-like protein [Catenuloplanes atrovinosus]